MIRNYHTHIRTDLKQRESPYRRGVVSVQDFEKACNKHGKLQHSIHMLHHTNTACALVLFDKAAD
jgi:hypothetical protein